MDRASLRKVFIGRAVPGILALLLNSAYVVVDGLFVARLIGRDALAAVTVAVPVVEILIALSMLVSVGAGVLISQQMGKGDAREGRRIFNGSVRIMLLFSVGIAVLGLLFHAQIGRLMGATADISPLVDEYLLYIFAFSPMLMFSFGLGTWARNDNQPRLAMFAMAVGTVTNIVLDYVFIAWCGWGIGGAALATGLGPVVSCAVLLPHFLRKKGKLYLERTRLHLADVKAVVFSGIPSFLMEFALGLTTLCVNIAVSHHFGALGLAAYGVVGYVALIVLTVFLGMAEGTQPLFSFYEGQGDHDANAYLLRLSLWICAVVGLISYGLLLAGARLPAVLFGGSDAALVDASVYAIRLYFPALFASGMNIQLASYLQSIGRWQRSAVISGLRSLAFLGVLLVLLPMIFGDVGVWTAVPVAELCTLSIAFCLLRERKSVPEVKVGTSRKKASMRAS